MGNRSMYKNTKDIFVHIISLKLCLEGYVLAYFRCADENLVEYLVNVEILKRG